MQDGELTNVSKINAGDEIINLGIIDKAEHTETSKLSMFTITNLWVIKAKNS